MKYQLLLMLSLILAGAGTCLAQDVPLVYDVEHTGSEFPDPVLPALDDLPIVRPLPDPFTLSNGTRRSTKFKD